jgi:hypothetical protein
MKFPVADLDCDTIKPCFRLCRVVHGCGYLDIAAAHRGTLRLLVMIVLRSLIYLSRRLGEMRSEALPSAIDAIREHLITRDLDVIAVS